MLDGLEVTEIKYSEVNWRNLHFRIDSDYFKKKYFKIEEIASKQKHLRLSDVEPEIIHPQEIKREYVENGGVLFFRTQNLRPLRIDLSNEVYVSSDDADTLKNNLIKKNDVLITRTGANFGDTLIVVEEINALASSHVFMLRNKIINQSYLSVFLNTVYGREQINRGMYGGVQPEISPHYLKNIIIPDFSGDFQKQIEKTVKSAYSQLRQSERLYAEAEEILLEELGLKNFDLKNSLFNVRKFSDTQLSDRLDSEHFNKKYDRLENKLKAYPAGFETIGNLCLPPINGVEVREYVEQGTPYLRVGDLRQLDISSDTVVYIDDKAADEVREKVSLQEGDVLISRSGSLGISSVVSKKWEDSITSSHLIRLRLKDKSLDPYYLALFMNTTAGVEQVRKRSNGGIQPEINQPSLKNIIVPLLSKKAQTKIRSLILRSQETREESKRLLELSKRAVESAIEKGEKAGMKVLEG